MRTDRAPRRTGPLAPPWTPEDDALVRSYQRGEGRTVAELLGRTVGAVKNRRSTLRRLDRTGAAPRYLPFGRPKKMVDSDAAQE